MAGVARAGGKVILLGEHAVVYGAKAIAAGIDRGASARARRAELSRLAVGERAAAPGDGSELGAAFGALLAELALGPHDVTVELELPAGSGLGASAAIGVAIARAVLDASGEPDSLARVLAAAGAWERVFHGNPSGVDAAAAAHGGCVVYARESGVRPLAVARRLPLVVALAGPPASTRRMVEGVAELRARRPETVDEAVRGIGALVESARSCVETGDLAGLGRLMDSNQALLSDLLVSTDGIERVCRLARAAGALGAKLTGAGGGGAVVALAADDTAPLVAALGAEGVPCFACEVAAGPGSAA